MAYPTIISTSTTGTTGGGYIETISFPDAIVGDILIALVSFQYTPFYEISGWNISTINIPLSTYDDGGSACWKLAEGNSNDNFSFSGSSAMVITYGVIRGADHFNWVGNQSPLPRVRMPSSLNINNNVPNDYLYIIAVTTPFSAAGITAAPSGWGDYIKFGPLSQQSINAGLAFKTSRDITNNGPIEWTYDIGPVSNVDDDWTAWSGAFYKPNKLTIGVNNGLKAVLDGNPLNDNLIIRY